jgi:hypothetical protein
VTHRRAIVEEWRAGSMPFPVARDVLLAAIELFAERGYHATTTRDIAARVGMSTGAMYAYFPSKKELLDPFRGYGSALSTGLPHAVRVLDAFHVVRPGFADGVKACVVASKQSGRLGALLTRLSRRRGGADEGVGGVPVPEEADFEQHSGRNSGRSRAYRLDE